MNQENIMSLNGLAEHYNDGSYIGICLGLSYHECCSYNTTPLYVPMQRTGGIYFSTLLVSASVGACVDKSP